MRGRDIVFSTMVVILVVMVALILLLAVMDMPPYGHPENPTNNYVMRRYVDEGAHESGGLNLVTNIVLDYRGYDTLLETTVLFTTVMAIILVWGVKRSVEETHKK